MYVQITDKYKDAQWCELKSSLVMDVLLERVRQDDKWGGSEHDDQHNEEYWIETILAYLMWAGQMARDDSGSKYRRRMLQVSALALASVESYDHKQSANQPLNGVKAR